MTLFVSHAQNWEDVRLRRLFGSVAEPGFYIDIGAAHPVSRSFTFNLNKQGWRGINVEPLSQFFSLFAGERPRDVNLQALVGRAEDGAVRFYEVPELPGNSTVDAELATELRAQGLVVIEHEVRQTTLRALCERYAPDRIDVLRIDVEGAEADVLAGADFDRFRPRLVVVEANRPELWEPGLLQAGYVKAAFDAVNNWYVERSDAAAWVPILEPPVSVLDNFVPYELLGARELLAQPSPPIASGVTSGDELPRLLVALSSSNQLYSGTGRVLFENLRRLRDAISIALAIDDEDARNVEIARSFGAEYDLPVYVGRPERAPDAPDCGNADLGAVLASGQWDIVLAVSWANAATNATVLEHVGDAALAYLPLHQPSWSIPLDDAGREHVERVEREMLTRADVTFCLTPFEREALIEFAAPAPLHLAVVPPGCDFDNFRPDRADRPLDLLFVGDHREPRKRFDRVLEVLGRLLERGIGARLLVIGNASDRAVVAAPSHIADAIVSLGYVTDERLARALPRGGGAAPSVGVRSVRHPGPGGARQCDARRHDQPAGARVALRRGGRRLFRGS